MKKITGYALALVVFSCMTFIACNSNNGQTKDSKQSTTDTNAYLLKNKLLSSDSCFINRQISNKLNKPDFDSWQLENIPELANASFDDLESEFIASLDTLYSGTLGKVLLIGFFTQGESKAWLVCYSPQNKYVSHLQVIYEDVVEYYTNISSTISNDTISIKTVNHSYEEENEKSDSTISKYLLNKELNFVKQ